MSGAQEVELPKIQTKIGRNAKEKNAFHKLNKSARSRNILLETNNEMLCRINLPTEQ